MFFSGVYVLADDPWVLAVADNSLAAASQQARAIGCKPHFLVFRTWYGGDLRGGLAALRILARARFPRVTWMCNAHPEVRMLRALGQQAIFCHHNLFCSERVFDIAVCPHQYDAIYIARLDPYKRIWLARDIARLRIVTANPNDAHRLRDWGCSHATINKQFMEYDAIAQEINKAKCGLALSQREGGMLATTEYLLCGKLVVTTPSLGGRDFWLDTRNSITVSPRSYAVAEAIAGIGSSSFDPHEIRAETISRLKGQRRILFEYVKQQAAKTAFDALEQMDADSLYCQFVLQKNIGGVLDGHVSYGKSPTPDSHEPVHSTVDSR
jgi:hypothetical protein